MQKSYYKNLAIFFIIINLGDHFLITLYSKSRPKFCRPGESSVYETQKEIFFRSDLGIKVFDVFVVQLEKNHKYHVIFDIQHSKLVIFQLYFMRYQGHLFIYTLLRPHFLLYNFKQLCVLIYLIKSTVIIM